MVFLKSLALILLAWYLAIAALIVVCCFDAQVSRRWRKKEAEVGLNQQ
jgi:hypothetical protein